MSGVATAIAASAVIGAVVSDKASSKASKASGKAADTAAAETRRAVDEARVDVNRLFPQAQQSSQQGFQGALDVFGQSLPAQTSTFQQGNIGAQQAILAGLPQIQNALLGNQVDFSQMQPFQVQQPDLGFFQQSLPQPQGVAQFGDAPTQFNGRMGPFQDTGNPLAGAVGSGGLNRSKGNFLLSHMNRN